MKQKYPFCVIKGLWDDFESVVTVKTVNLKEAKVGSIALAEEDDSRKRPEDGITTIPYNCIDVMTMQLYRKEFKVKSKELVNILKAAGCFYQIEKDIYIPTDDVKRRGIYDYFRKTDEKRKKKSSGIEYEDINLKAFSGEETLRNFAQRFRKIESVNFIGERIPGSSCLRLIGLKSDKKTSEKNAPQNIFDILKAINGYEKWKMGNDYYTDYDTHSIDNLVYSVTCDVKIRTKNGFPLYVTLTDTATGRKSMQIDICTSIHGRMYIVDSVDIAHRTTKTTEAVVKEIDSLLMKYENCFLNASVTADLIEKTCKSSLPKKAQNRFKELIRAGHKVPIEAAYDAMDELFTSEKSFKTKDYDRGKRKFNISLGSVLKTC